ncbi:hypothetical protein N7516_006820, partial [Penicillium verrucosum]|uniref:uncharacterized protein n=1 Tax=Penicillium verrucosum TaxID=60171 RepID=UPI00254534A6
GSRYGSHSPTLDEWSIPSEKLSVGTGTGSAGIILGCIIAPLLPPNMVARLGSWSCPYSSLCWLEASAVASFWQIVVGESLFILVLDSLQILFQLIYLSARHHVFEGYSLRSTHSSLHSVFIATFGSLPYRRLLLIIRSTWIPHSVTILSRTTALPHLQAHIPRSRRDNEKTLPKRQHCTRNCFKGTNLPRTIACMGVQILQQAQTVSFVQNFIVTFMQ